MRTTAPQPGNVCATHGIYWGSFGCPWCPSPASDFGVRCPLCGRCVVTTEAPCECGFRFPRGYEPAGEIGLGPVEAVTARNRVTAGLCCGLEMLQAVPTFGDAECVLLGMLAAEVTPDYREGMSLAARMYQRCRGETVALRRDAG